MSNNKLLSYEEIVCRPGIYRYALNPVPSGAEYLMLVGPAKFGQHENSINVVCLQNGKIESYTTKCGLTEQGQCFEKLENMDYKVVLFIKE